MKIISWEKFEKWMNGWDFRASKIRKIMRRAKMQKYQWNLKD